MAVVHLQQASVPSLFVTKGRQRVKQYGNVIYLKNGDEFELELFNPTQNKVLAKINLNGKSLGNGLVLRPGERVFLERYFDEARKFLFETYEINGADAAAKAAIVKNGAVDVEFFDEYKPYPYWTNTIYYTNTGVGSNPMYGNSSASINAGARGMSSGTLTNSCSGSCSCSSYSADATKDFAPVDFDRAFDFAPQETGRVEKGSNSNQDFNYDSTQFNTYCSWRTSWTILPESNRPYISEDIKVFCTNCGAKRKKSSHTFCPKCGNRF